MQSINSYLWFEPDFDQEIVFNIPWYKRKCRTKKAFYRRLKCMSKIGFAGVKFRLVAKYQGTNDIVKTCKSKGRNR